LDKELDQHKAKYKEAFLMGKREIPHEKADIEEEIKEFKI